MAITERYQPGGTVFTNWQISGLIRRDPETNSAWFRLVRNDDPSVQCALKVVTILQENLLSSQQLWELEARSNFCKETAANSILQNQDVRDCPYLLPCLEWAFLDWQEPGAFGCDMLMRTELREDLRSRLDSGHRLTEEEIRRLGSDLCAALNFLHGKQRLHRSIRPENIYCSPEGLWMLGDSVAADVQNAFPGNSVHAPQYSAPEQFQNVHYPVSDIYSLGLVMYELANGSLPFAAASQNVHQAINTRIQGYAIPQPSQTSALFSAVILQACAADPAARYQSASQLLGDLVGASRPAPVVPPAPVAPPQQPVAAGYIKPQPIRQPDPIVHWQPDTRLRNEEAYLEEEDEEEEEEKEKSDSKVILIVRTAVITLLILLALGAGVFFYLKMQNSDSATPGTQPPQNQSTIPQATSATLSPVATMPQEETEPVAALTLPEGHYYYSCYNPYTEFVLPDSDIRYYAPGELKNFTDKQLDVALAEIYARHGVTPANALLAEYFSYLSWFLPRNEAYTLSQVEESNALLIQTLQKKRSGNMSQYVNPYMPYFQPDAYFMPESSTRYLTSHDLSDLSKNELSLALNEIFARHGYIFGANTLLEYFYCTNWYVPTYTEDEFTYNFFSKEESENIELILAYLNIVDYSGPRASNPYIQYLTYSGFVIPNSTVTRLQESDLEGLNDTQLYLAEMEIYARYGMAFEDTDLQHYFLSCTWYTIEYGMNRTSRINLTALERANLELIRAYRESR